MEKIMLVDDAAFMRMMICLLYTSHRVRAFGGRYRRRLSGRTRQMHWDRRQARCCRRRGILIRESLGIWRRRFWMQM